MSDHIALTKKERNKIYYVTAKAGARRFSYTVDLLKIARNHDREGNPEGDGPARMYNSMET